VLKVEPLDLHLALELYGLDLDILVEFHCYTPCPEKICYYIIVSNFAKCWLIFSPLGKIADKLAEWPIYLACINFFLFVFFLIIAR